MRVRSQRDAQTVSTPVPPLELEIMSGFDDIVTVLPEAAEVPQGLPLVVALSGFSDAGQLISQFDETVAAHGDETVIAEFATDILFDYRARRPLTNFDGVRVVGVDVPRLELSLIDIDGEPGDDGKQSFLFLHGYEPDFRWQTVVACLEEFIVEFGVSSVTTLHSIPMPVPHTRPIQSTVSGNREEIRSRWSAWEPHTQFPGSIVHLLELRLFEDSAGDVPFAGFVLLVPHYLADSELPSVLVAALGRLNDAAGVNIVAPGLAERESGFLAKVAEQIADNEELSALVAALEERFDDYMDGLVKSQHGDIDMSNLPTADEIAAEFESFLAAQSKKDGDSEK